MVIERCITVVHKNCLSAYLSGWKMCMHMIFMSVGKMRSEEEAQRYRIKRIPTPFQSFSFNTHDLCVLLAHLDDRLRVLEETPLTTTQFPHQVYGEARVFLKSCYIFFRILLDDLSGIIEYFYKKNEQKVEVKKSFYDLLKKAEIERLPKDLLKLLEGPSLWFPEMKRRRDDLVHEYDSFLISFDRGKDDAKTVGHFSTKGAATSDYEDVRKYFEVVCCEYQKLIDDLLDHFDRKFADWYGIIQGKGGRTSSIMHGYAGIILWWAYRYGNYRHEDFQVIEGNNGLGG